MSEEVREDVRLAVEELGRNAVEWGNKFDHHKRVRLSYRLFDDRIVFRIEDEGEGFLPEAVPDPSIDPIAHVERRAREGKRHGGFGIHIVKSMMDAVEYNEKGNVVEMTKYFY
jgi:serine/threonine-protein kinase RsbW